MLQQLNTILLLQKHASISNAENEPKDELVIHIKEEEKCKWKHLKHDANYFSAVMHDVVLSTSYSAINLFKMLTDPFFIKSAQHLKKRTNGT